MLRLKEVASQVETFSKRVWQKQKPQEMRIVLIGPLRAKASKCFLLTGRLYWLLGASLGRHTLRVSEWFHR